MVTLNEKTRMKMSKDIEFELNQGKDVKMPSMRKIYVLCSVIPFVLFWAGITSPLWTDNFIVYIFALAPFYTFFAILSIYEKQADCGYEKKMIVASGTSAFISSVTSLLGVISFFDVWKIPNDFLFAPRLMLAVNFIPSMILVLSCAFDKAFTEIPRDADLYVADD